MASVTHAQLRHGTRLAFDAGLLVEVIGRAGDVQATLAWEAVERGADIGGEGMAGAFYPVAGGTIFMP